MEVPVTIPRLTTIRTYAGIDPGINGGVVLYERHYAIGSDVFTHESWVTMPMPTVVVGKGRKELDLVQLADFLRKHEIRLATVEYPPKVPGNGVLGTASLFKGFGEIRGILATLNIPRLEPGPQVWKKDILVGTAKDKDAAIAFVRQRLPALNLPMAGPRSKKYHDGIADAACLCWYGFLQSGDK